MFRTKSLYVIWIVLAVALLITTSLCKTDYDSSVMANDYLDRLDTAGYIRVDRTAGLDMIYPVRELNPRNIIEDFYENN